MVENAGTPKNTTLEGPSYLGGQGVALPKMFQNKTLKNA